MRPINDLLSSVLSVLGFANFFYVTCASSDDSKLDNLRLLASIEGVDDIIDEAILDRIDPQYNSSALAVLRESVESEKLFQPDGGMIYPNVTKNDNEFPFFLHVKNSSMIIVFTPCGSLPVTWRLFHRPRPPNGQPLTNEGALFSVHPTDKEIYKFTGSQPSFFRGSGMEDGLYLVQVLSENDTRVQIHASTAEGAPTVVNIVDSTTDPEIRVQKNFTANPPIARLLLPKLYEKPGQNNPLFYLVFVISKKKFYHSLCNVMFCHPERKSYIDDHVSCDNIQNDTELQVCRADGYSTTQVDLKLEMNHRYFISVFAWDLGNGLSVWYSEVHFNFKKLVRLRDGVPQEINMTTNGGNFPFKFKIRKNNTGMNSKLLFYVFPYCASSGSVVVEAKLNKRVLLKDQINKYKKFEIPHPLAGRRYTIVIRVPKLGQGCDLVEVMATVRPNVLFPLPPKYAKDTRINATMQSTCATNTSAGNVSSLAVISWFPVSTKELLEYCLYVKPILASETGSELNRTNVFYSLLTESRRHYMCRNSTTWENKQPFYIEVYRLKPRVNYAAQVIVRKPKHRKRFLSYEILTGIHYDC